MHACLLTAALLLASPPAAEGSPAAGKFQELMTVIDAGDEARLRSWVGENFSAAMLRANPGDPGIAQFLVDQQRNLGGFEVQGILKSHPSQVEMQVRALLEAACELTLAGIEVKPEIMIPLSGHVNEVRLMNEVVLRVARQVFDEKGVVVDYKFGTMIEIPRAALTADEMAEVCQFFSFGTNDLTQMTYGISRDDAETGFLLQYVERKVLPANPFQTLDINGVGKLVRFAVENGRATRPDLEVGICGEHGGDPDSIAFCHDMGLNYVSCSPFRVPIARLAAAHAALRGE